MRKVVVAGRIAEAGEVAGHLFLTGEATDIGHARAVEFHHIGGHGAGMRQSERWDSSTASSPGLHRHKVMVVDGGVDRFLPVFFSRSFRSEAVPWPGTKPHCLAVAVAIAAGIARNYLGEADAGFCGGGGAFAFGQDG